MRRNIFGIIFAAGLMGFAVPSFSQTVPEETVEEVQEESQKALPLPRFVTLRSKDANVRVGPGTKYAIRWVYKMRQGMPMEIVEEFDHWRKVRDIEGDTGWIMKGMLTSARSAMVKGASIQLLRRLPEVTSPILARVEPKTYAKILECNEEWCRLSFDSVKGWLPKAALWGVYPQEIIQK